MKQVNYIDKDLFTPKTSWDALSLEEQAAMMEVAVSNGITSLDDIKRKYNEFAEGGNLYGGGRDKQPVTTGGAGYIPPANSDPKAGTLKDIAYRAMGQGSHQARGIASVSKAVLESMASQPYNVEYSGSFLIGDAANKSIMDRDLNHLIMYGNTKGQYKPKKISGFDYKNYINRMYGKDTLPTYEGQIIPASKVNIPSEYTPLVEYLADRPKYGYYVNTDEDGINSIIEDEVPPFNHIDDTAAHRRSFRRNSQGTPELAAQDIIDYGDNYGSKYGTLAGIQGNMLNKVINSPVILDQGVPIKYSDNPNDFNTNPGWYYTLKGIVDNNKILKNSNSSDADYVYPLVLPEVTVTNKKKALGGNLYGKGGYTSSDNARKRIANWEGKAMTGAKDPLSGKFLKNNSFEYEDKAFYNALPKTIRDRVLSNSDLADNLYSYSYNVGAGNFKKRVVPILQKYYDGKATIKEVTDSMWASGDKKLKGLQKRRAYEKKAVGDALFSELQSKVIPPTTAPVDNVVVRNPFVLREEAAQLLPVNVPKQNSYVETTTLSPSDIRKERVNTAFENFNKFNALMNLINVQNNPAPVYEPQNDLLSTIGMLTRHSYGNGGNI